MRSLLRSHDRPIFSPVEAVMLGPSHNGKILGPVIRDVPVTVMHNLGCQQRPAKHSLHDETMLLDAPPLMEHHDVSMIIETTFLPVSLIAARHRAVVRVVSLYPARNSSKHLAANRTNRSDALTKISALARATTARLFTDRASAIYACQCRGIVCLRHRNGLLHRLFGWRRAPEDASPAGVFACLNYSIRMP